MESARIGGLALVGLVALFLLRQVKPEWTPFVRLGVGLLAMGFIISMVATVLGYVSDLSALGGGVLEGDAGRILIKALGIAFLSEVAASVCRDSGEGGLAGWVEMAGRLEILLLAFPLIRTVLDTVAGLLGGA